MAIAPTRLLTHPAALLSPRRRFLAAAAAAAAAAGSSPAFHTLSPLLRGRQPTDQPAPSSPPPTDFERLDVLSAAPAPATSVDACLPDGFRLGGGGVTISRAGALLIGGEAFAWRPWLLYPSPARLINAKGQWDVPPEAFGLLGLVWPRPDLLILGLGPEMRPLSPATRKYIGSLGVRVDVLDTRNAASQYNLLATERGVTDVAAALIPLGWKDGETSAWRE